MQRIEFKSNLTVNDAGEITGIAWPFGSPDSVGDIIERGAFAVSSKTAMLFEHDRKQTVGVWDAITETNAGLEVKGRLLVDDIERAREVRALVQAGAITGLSIGFKPKLTTKRLVRGRIIKSLDLHEISLVGSPSHPGARITSAKSVNASAVLSALNHAILTFRK